MITDAGIDVDLPEASRGSRHERGRSRYLLELATPFRHALGSMSNLSERLARQRMAPARPWQLDHTGAWVSWRSDNRGAWAISRCHYAGMVRDPRWVARRTTA